jgi:hypothetical protein
MTSETHAAASDLQELADRDAVYRHAFEGQPLDPEVRRRVRERAARITADIHRTRGLVDDETFQKLLGDDDEQP